MPDATRPINDICPECAAGHHVCCLDDGTSSWTDRCKENLLMNAIERLRAPLALHLSMAASGEQPTAQSLAALDDGLEALVAVDALYQAAKALTEKRGIKVGEWDAVAAAVRRIEGESTDEPPVSPFHTEPVPS